MSYVTGKDSKLHELAQRLAPGRKVTRIQLDFPCRGIATATVEVHLDKSDMDLVGEVVEEQQPTVTFTDTPDVVRGTACVNGGTVSVFLIRNVLHSDNESPVGIISYRGRIGGSLPFAVGATLWGTFDGFAIRLRITSSDGDVISDGAPVSLVTASGNFSPEAMASLEAALSGWKSTSAVVAPALSFPTATYMGRSVEAVDEPTIVE